MNQAEYIQTLLPRRCLNCGQPIVETKEYKLYCSEICKKKIEGK